MLAGAVVAPEGIRGLWDREAEVLAIGDALDRTHGGEGGLLVLGGAAGIGKSALLRVAGRMAEERGQIVLRARAAPFERQFPYGVVRQLFEPVLARRDLDGEVLFSGAAVGARTVLGDEPGTAAAQDASFASLHALYWLTVNLVPRAPVLVCVDDVSWSDEPSLRFLEFLVRRIEGMPVTVAVTHRSGEPGSSPVADGLLLDPLALVLRPMPLREAALEEMLTAKLAQAVDAGFCTACHQATGGNPLLVTELLRALEYEGVHPGAREVARVRRIGAIAVGPAVMRRLGALEEPAQAAARAVAILGESVRCDDLAATAGIGVVELDDRIESLASAGIVRLDGERVSFVHPLVAEAVRASVSPSERAELHEQAARVLEQRGASPWEVAPHLVAGAVGAHPEAEGRLREAARWSLAAGAPDAAASYLSRALLELDEGADQAPLLLELGSAKLQAGDPTAPEELERAIALARDARTRAMGRMALSEALFAAGRLQRAIEVLDEGIDVVGSEVPDLALRLEAQLLGNLEVAGPSLVNFPESIRERLSRARATRDSLQGLSGRLVLCCLAHEEYVGGGTAAAVIALADRALADDEVLLAEGPACLPLYLVSVGLLLCDELDRAAAILTATLAEARRLASITGFVWASAWRAYVNLRLGRLLDAEADARAALDSGDPRSAGPGILIASGWLAGSLAEQGHLNEADAVLATVPLPDPPSEVTFALLESRARLRLAQGRYREAADDLELCHELNDERTDLVTWRRQSVGFVNHSSLRARALIRLGDIDGARAVVEQERPLANALGTRRAIGMNLHSAGLLEQGAARIETLRRATEELSHSQSKLEYAKALCDFGAALRRANRRADARAPLKAALAIARNARAAPLRDLAAQELKATGERVSRPDASGVQALTASEQRIASMAATGMSNRDIAQALFVTHKTVETHLGHVYRKLDLASRTQLAAALGESGTSAESVLDARLAEAGRR